MPASYCSLITEVDSIPPEADMVLFKPYFTVPDGCTCFEAKIKLPSNCYFIESVDPNAPAGGPCGAAGELQCCINVNQTSGCTNTDETVYSVTLNYSQNNSGHKLNVYLVDNSDSARVGGGTRTTKTVTT